MDVAAPDRRLTACHTSPDSTDGDAGEAVVLILYLRNAGHGRRGGR